MAACAFAVSYTGATPVFADVEQETYGLSFTEVAKRVTNRTKAIMLVHVYGRLARDREAIFELGKYLNIPIIEDACEAQGAVYKSKATLTCYSFYRNKIIAAEEGGMVATDDKALAARVGYFKNMCFTAAHDYMHNDIGYNYRMPNAMAKVALKSLARYPQNAHKRRQIERWYDELSMQHKGPRDAVWFYETLVVDKAWTLGKLGKYGARDAFKPLSSMPMYGGGPGLPIARYLADRLVLLPVRPDMKKRDVTMICDFYEPTCQSVPQKWPRHQRAS